ncbi:MAG: sugar ABC transporter permease [Spirochaetota bacterium]
MIRKFRFRGSSYSLGESATAFFILVPTLVLILLFVLWPLVQVFYLSLTNWSLSKGTKAFIGLENFSFLLKDPNFQKSIRTTFLYSFIKIPMDLVLALGCAVLLDKAVPFRRFIRAAYFAPVIVPIVASALIWIWFYDPGIGPFNAILKLLGQKPLQWLSDERTALLSIIVFSVWRGLGYDILLFLTGLQGISETYIEAARIDGASPIQIFFRIKLPLLSPIVYFVLLMGIINSFKVFTEISVMTPNGGPLYSTGVMVYYIYEAAFTRSRFGRAAAASVVLFAIVLLLTLLQKQIAKKSVFDE